MSVQKKREEILYRVFVIIIILSSLLGMLYFGARKSGYHVDEIYSYGLANSEYLPFMHFGEHSYDVKDWMKEYGAGESFGELFGNLWKDFQMLKEADFDIYATPLYQDYRLAQQNSADTKTTTWVDGEDYLHYIAVSPENTFNYASVYYNQRGDVHPPFFYIILHTVCSVFQGSFSKWYGLGINMLFMLLTLFVLCKLCNELFSNKLLTVLILAMYGVSSGFMTTAMFIRMYAIFTFWVVLSCYLHLKALDKCFALKSKEYLKLAVVTILGFYTHYYFVIYAIGVAVVCCVYMLYHRYLKRLWKYVATMACSAVFGICIWPFAIKHVFLGYRGRGSLQAITQVEAYFIRIKLMLGAVFGPTMASGAGLFLVVAAIVVVLAILTGKKQLPMARIALVSFPATCYVLLVSQIVPFYTDRYVMCIYPFVCILLMSGIYFGIRMLVELLEKVKVEGLVQWLGKYNYRLTAGLMILVALVICCRNNYLVNMPGYLYPQGQELVTVPANTDCVFVLPDGDWNESAEESSILAQCRRVGIVYESNIEVLKPDYVYCPGDYLLVYIQKNMDVEQVLSKLHDTLGTGELKEVSRQNSGGAVRILLTDG